MNKTMKDVADSTKFTKENLAKFPGDGDLQKASQYLCSKVTELGSVRGGFAFVYAENLVKIVDKFNKFCEKYDKSS